MLKTHFEAHELKAIRLTLGLDVAEASEICGVSKRSFQYWESGKNNVPSDVVELFSHYAHVYWLVHRNMGQDIETWEDSHPLPDTNDTEEYVRLIKDRLKLALPFYRTFSDFAEKTGNKHIFSYRIYQSVVNHYFTIERIHGLTDSGVIPAEFKKTLFWLSGGYDAD